MGDALQTGAQWVNFSGKTTVLAAGLSVAFALPAAAFDIQLTITDADEDLQA